MDLWWAKLKYFFIGMTLFDFYVPNDLMRLIIGQLGDLLGLSFQIELGEPEFEMEELW